MRYMKCRIILTLIILSFPIGVSAQEKVFLEPALLECRYLETVEADTVAHRMVPDTMVLQIGRNTSAFFSKDRVFVDSLRQTRNGFNKWIALMRQYLNEGHYQDLLSNDGAYYYLDYPEKGRVLVRTEVNGKGVAYEEEREAIAWEFRDSVITVLGFECHLAEADFRGRHWLAWYTLEVPVSQGPWMLWGLPGLICEAYDDQRHYCYTLVSLTPDPAREIVLFNWKKSYEKKSRFEIYEAMSNNAELLREDARQSGMGGWSNPGMAPGARIWIGNDRFHCQ